MRHKITSDRVLSVYLTSKGFAFTVFEGPMLPIDWGVKNMESRERNARCFEAVAKLTERYNPDTFVIEDCTEKGSRRSVRIRRSYRALEKYARHQFLNVRRYSREEIRQCFAGLGAATKYEIAQTLSKLVPALSHRMPRVRKLWMSVDSRMGIFDAASLAWTFFRNTNPHQDQDTFESEVRERA